MGHGPVGTVRRAGARLVVLAVAASLLVLGSLALAEGAVPGRQQTGLPASSPMSAPPAGWIEVSLEDNSFGGAFWWDGGVAVEIRDGTGGQSLWSDPQVSTPDGQFHFDYGSFGFTLRPGYEITVSDGWNTRVLVLVDFGIDVIDYDTDVVYGHGPSGPDIWVAVGDDSGHTGVYTSADSSGTWQAHPEFDLTEAGWVFAQVFDEDGDFQSATRPLYQYCATLGPTIVGTNGADTLVGTSGRDVIVGLGGGDTITGLGGRDVICGGPGNDTIHGGSGNDRLLGDAGRDRLFGEGGDDTLLGGPGADRAVGGPGTDHCVDETVLSCEP